MDPNMNGPAQGPENKEGKIKKILYVEDDPSIREGMAALLEMKGYEVVMAKNVQEFEQKAASEQFDLIISDNNLNDTKTGFDVMRKILATNPRQRFMMFSADEEIRNETELKGGKFLSKADYTDIDAVEKKILDLEKKQG